MFRPRAAVSPDERTDLPLSPFQRRRLHGSWVLPFRDHVLPLIDEYAFAQFFHANHGAPNRSIATVVGIWEWHFVRGEFRNCAELVAEAMEFARSLDDPGGMLEAFYTAGQTMLYRADFGGARDRFATGVAEFDDPGRTNFWAEQTGHYARVNIPCNLAVSLWHLGYPDQALRVNQEVCLVAREIGHPFSLAYALHHTAWLFTYCRLGAEVRAAAEEEIAIAAEQGFALWHATGTFFSGAAMLLDDELDDALPQLVKGVDAFRTSGAELTLPFQFSTLGEAYMRAGAFDAARRVLNEGLAIAEKNDERCQEAELHRQRGDLVLAEAPEQTKAAEDCFRLAIDTAQRQRSKAWELRATMSLARLWQRQGRRSDAHQMLSAVHASYTEGWRTPDLIDAAALLRDLS